MTEEQIKELERLAKAATPGPWMDYVLGEFLVTTFEDTIIGKTYKYEDSEYIAAACNAVPELIAENRELRERVRELERQRDWLAERLAFICRSHNDCVLGCPNALLKIDCPDVTFEQWIEAAKEAGK